MALVALVLFVVIVAGFIGAALSSRARMEKKSIASFHEQMGQLSGVVQPELQQDVDQGTGPHELFTEAPVHVKVVGKATRTKSATGRTSTPRKGRQRLGGPISVDSRTELARPRQVPSSQVPSSQVSPLPLTSKESVEPGEDVARVGGTAASAPTGNDGVTQPPSGPAGRRRRSSKVSASARAGGVVSKTQVLRFDEGPTVGDSGVEARDLKGFERKVNPKTVAIASAAAVAGLVAIVAIANAESSTSSRHIKNAGASPPAAKPPSRHAQSTAPAPVQGPTSLLPSSTSASGAVYFVNAPSLTVTVTASSPSWVEESVSPGSPVLWQGILSPGATKTFTLSSSMWIRTGNVDKLSLVVNGRAVKFSASPGPYNFTFSQGVKA